MNWINELIPVFTLINELIPVINELMNCLWILVKVDNIIIIL